jgi:hypothetical protein
MKSYRYLIAFFAVGLLLISYMLFSSPSPTLPCGGGITFVNAPKTASKEADIFCHEWMRKTGEDPTTALSGLVIEFISVGQPFTLCKSEYGCAVRGRVELRRDEDWRRVLAHELAHIVLLTKDMNHDNPTHHRWMLNHRLCYGYCADITGAMRY